jgi:hypothetical protein
MARHPGDWEGGVKLKLVKFDGLDDWYLIERAEHDGREWEEERGRGSVHCMRSCRIDPGADVEGTAEQMLCMARAIRARGEYHAKRCAVVIVGNEARFCSRKNSRPGFVHEVVSLEDADDLAEQIERELGAQ